MTATEHALPPMLLKIGVRTIINALRSSGLNVPSTDKRLFEFIFIDNGLEVVGVSLRMVILSFQRLTTLSLSARVIADLMKGDCRVNDREMNRMTGTDEVKILEELGIIELFLKRQSGTRETGDKDDGRFGWVTGSMRPDLSAVLRLHELSERGHDKEIQGSIG